MLLNVIENFVTILHFAVSSGRDPWVFKHWPNDEDLTNLTDRKPHTCVKFTAVQLEKKVLLKSPGPVRLISPNWRILMISKNLVLPSECESSILVMTQFGESDITDELLCRPFCGKLIRGNLSKPYPRVDNGTNFLSMNRNASSNVVMASFPCDYHHPCKGIFIHITEKARPVPRSDLEICEIILRYISYHGRRN